MNIFMDEEWNYRNNSKNLRNSSNFEIRQTYIFLPISSKFIAIAIK